MNTMSSRKQGDQKKSDNVTSLPNLRQHATGNSHKDEASAPNLDRMAHQIIGHMTGGLDPVSTLLAYMDWMLHLGQSPDRQKELLELMADLVQDQDITVDRGDHRFDHEGWNSWPFSQYRDNFLRMETWWDAATKNVRGVSKHHQDQVSFSVRQMVDIFSPSNFPALNPAILEKTWETFGANLVQGVMNAFADMRQVQNGDLPADSANFVPGTDVATTPGKIVFRNHLIEVMQYAPQTDLVHAEPVLITPAWIMKYYILDLSPENSMVDYLVKQGHTVFMISWKNPDAKDRDLGFEDYLTDGLMEAVKAVQTIVPGQKINATGYCLGGTLLSIAAATYARDAGENGVENPFNSVTLFATQVDFDRAGELKLFIDESQLAMLEDLMAEKGYLDSSRMAGAFSLLRSNDLVWSKMIQDYWLGDRRPLNDLMAWNADATRMPERMHKEYLRQLYLNNALANGHFKTGGKPLSLTDIRAPVFAVGTEKDHVAPWKSVYKLHLLLDTDVTFVLASGGHNTGIVSEPGHPRRHYQIATHQEADKYIAAADWATNTQSTDGSWWPAWSTWLGNQNAGKMVKPPKTGAASKGYKILGDAPGDYVHLT